MSRNSPGKPPSSVPFPVVLVSAAAAVVVMVVLMWPAPPPPPQAQAVPAPTPVSTRPASSGAPSLASVAGQLKDPASGVEGPVLIKTNMDKATAQKFIDDQNRVSQQQHEALQADGWKPVDLPPPDQGLISLDPGLLNGREPELQKQLETTALHDSQLENAQTIALQAKEPRTRYAAIQALGHSHSPRAQFLLTDVFDQLQDPGERSQVLGYLHPRSLDEPAVNWMLQKMSSPDIAPVMKKQISYSLVLAEMVQSGAADPAKKLPQLMQQIPPGLRPMVLETYRALTGHTQEPPH